MKKILILLGIVLKLLVPSNLELDKILSQIRAQKHVLKVNRQ